MEDILEAVRRTIYRWVNTTADISVQANQGDTLITVPTTHRFRVGDEVSLVNFETSRGEPGHIISDIIDLNLIRLSSPIRASQGFGPSYSSKIVKTWNGNFIRAIYIDSPDVIPIYPAISITPGSKKSSWLTLGMTTEDYNIDINTYVQADSNETSYRYLLRVTKAIENGLKKNIFPLVGDYSTSAITANVSIGDNFIKVEDATKFFVEQKILIENIYQCEEMRICNIVDSTTLQVVVPPANPYLISENSKIIGLTRFIYNSWPADIKYGFIHKGSLLKASTISWFAKETEQQTRGGWSDPQIT